MNEKDFLLRVTELSRAILANAGDIKTTQAMANALLKESIERLVDLPNIPLGVAPTVPTTPATQFALSDGAQGVSAKARYHRRKKKDITEQRAKLIALLREP